MKRRILHFFVAASLLLCVATGALWIWSYWEGITWFCARNTDFTTADGEGALADNVHFEISFGHGVALLFYYDDPPLELEMLKRIDTWERRFDHSQSPIAPRPWSLNGDLWRSRWGFGAAVHWRPRETRWIAIQTQLWVPFVVFAILPCWQLRRKLRRHAIGLCQQCGYDLRATPDRCPECGTARAAE
jgi:hypothetical protein